MSENVLKELSGAEERLAAARSRICGTFGRAFEYPDDELCEAIRSGDLVQALRGTLAEIDPSLAEGGDWQALQDAGDEDDLAVEYTRLFDVGASGPPCALYGGLYVGARMKTMEEVVRFYNHFGLTLSDAPRELPDHITTELEFLHYLAFREAEALQRGEDAGPFRRAQRDFISRHPGRWVTILRKRLEEAQPMRFFRELVAQLEGFLEHERQTLVKQAGPVSTGSPPPVA
jgi:DMSO reductase family type II enzyme chaperone